MTWKEKNSSFETFRIDHPVQSTILWLLITCALIWIGVMCITNLGNGWYFCFIFFILAIFPFIDFVKSVIELLS